MTRIDLFVIDGQNDFCASGGKPRDDAGRRGALFVEGADAEAENVAKLITRLGSKLTKIHATLDNHHRNDGSHHVSWKGTDGSTPPPFTMIGRADVEAGTWVPRFRFGIWNGEPIPSREWALRYTTALEENGRAPLCLWPIHCQIGTWGSNMYQPLWMPKINGARRPTVGSTISPKGNGFGPNTIRACEPMCPTRPAPKLR